LFHNYRALPAAHRGVFHENDFAAIPAMHGTSFILMRKQGRWQADLENFARIFFPTSLAWGRKIGYNAKTIGLHGPRRF